GRGRSPRLLGILVRQLMGGPQLCPCRRFALSSALARKCCISQATYVPTRLQPFHSRAAVSNTCGWIFFYDARRVLLSRILGLLLSPAVANKDQHHPPRFVNRVQTLL